MNIAFLHRDLPPQSFTGVAVQVHRLANALCSMGHQVTVFTFSPKPPEALYEIHPLDFPGRAFLKKYCGSWKRLWIPWSCRRLDFAGFDAVHVHGDGGFLSYRSHWVRTFYGTAALEARHASQARARWAQRISYALEKREAHRCRQAAAISAHVREFLPGIHWIVPCMTAEPDASGRPPQKTPHPSLIYLGARGGRKRGEVALQLLQELRSEFSDLELHYVGPENERTRLEKTAAFPGLRFHARIPETELQRLYQSSWIYLCCSSYEGFGVPWAEAMASDCCVVSTPHAGASEWLRDGENALLRPPENLREAVTSLLRDPSRRENLIRHGRDSAAEFSPARAAESYLEIYRQAQEPQ